MGTFLSFDQKPLTPEEMLWQALEEALGENVPESIRAPLRDRKEFPSWLNKVKDPEGHSRTIAGIVEFAKMMLQAQRSVIGLDEFGPSKAEWRRESERLFGSDTFREWQREAWRVLSLDAPLTLAQVPGRLLPLLAKQRMEGDFRHLVFSTGRNDRGWEMVGVWTGVSHSERRWRAQRANAEDVRRGDGEFTAWEEFHRWRDGHVQPLARLAELQDKVVASSGVPTWEATHYLLCDIVPTIRRVRVFGSTALPGRIDITVGSSLITGEEVKRAYEAWLRSMGIGRPRKEGMGRPGNADLAVEFADRFRQPDPERQGKLPTWEETFDAFDKKHPGMYRDWRSFVETVRTRRRGKA